MFPIKNHHVLSAIPSHQSISGQSYNATLASVDMLINNLAKFQSNDRKD